MKEKILVLDGISGISLGKEIEQVLRDSGCNSQYTASESLRHKTFYKPVSEFKKAIHRQFLGQDYYRHPKIKDACLVNLIEEFRPDIIFVIGFLYRFFDLNLIQELKLKYNFRLYLYDTDSGNLFSNKRELVFFVNNELPLYDHIYSFSRTTTHFINKLNNLTASYFPFGANLIHYQEHKKIHDVLFVGSADMRRIHLLEHLTPFKLSVYGSKWQRNQSVISTELNKAIKHNTIWGDELYQQIFKSKIILNITRSTFYSVETGVNLRIFETLAAKSFLLTDYTPELQELFQIGQEIECYTSSKELVDKVNYYLKHDDKRIKIAQQGHQAFLEKYTWETRLKILFSDIENSNKSSD